MSDTRDESEPRMVKKCETCRGEITSDVETRRFCSRRCAWINRLVEGREGRDFPELHGADKVVWTADRQRMDDGWALVEGDQGGGVELSHDGKGRPYVRRTPCE